MPSLGGEGPSQSGGPGDQCLCDAQAGLPSCQLEVVWEVTHLPHSLG